MCMYKKICFDWVDTQNSKWHISKLIKWSSAPEICGVIEMINTCFFWWFIEMQNKNQWKRRIKTKITLYCNKTTKLKESDKKKYIENEEKKNVIKNVISTKQLNFLLLHMSWVKVEIIKHNIITQDDKCNFNK